MGAKKEAPGQLTFDDLAHAAPGTSGGRRPAEGGGGRGRRSARRKSGRAPRSGPTPRSGGARRSPTRRRVPHRTRPVHKWWMPMHITLRAVHGLPSFRQQVLYEAFETAFRTTRRPDFRIVEYSVQANHLHLVVEADDNDALARGMASFAVRANRLFNAAWGRMRGRVWGERYHRHDLTTPREVRSALVYVFGNYRKHEGITSTEPRIDAFSSARWFGGWTMIRTRRDGPRPTEAAETKLLRDLWKKHGFIHPAERPAARRPPGRPVLP